MIRKILIAGCLVLAFASYAMAALTEEEAAKLGGPTLTVVGAEKAGSKDGVIPPYTGGITKGPDGWYYEGKLKVPFSEYDPTKSGIRPDPFADDKVLYSINSENMAKYADKLSVGAQALMKKYPGWRIDVYPTRRSVAYSKEIIDGTLKSARTAKLENDGKTLTGARMGFPFPIPKTGLELMYNHLVRWSGNVESGYYRSYVVNASGRVVMTTYAHALAVHPYWNPNVPNPKLLGMYRDSVIGPPNRNGEDLLWYNYLDSSKNPAWQYLPGQRRVKIAPEIAFDGPNTTVAGAAVYDESFIFIGSPEMYDWKIVGKKEMIVPYNQYYVQYHSKAKTLLGPHFENPDGMRWEVHRVWVLHGTLKPGKRHIYKQRTLFIEEDVWYALMADQYDQKNQIYRVLFDTPVFNYDYPAPFNSCYVGYDFVTGIYYRTVYAAETGGLKYIPSLPKGDWAPQALAGSGIR